MSKVLDNVTHPPAKVAKAVLLRRRRGLARGHGDDWAAALAESLVPVRAEIGHHRCWYHTVVLPGLVSNVVNG